jgi:hypothetical protein
MRLWVDDMRPKPVAYDVWVKTSDEAIAQLKTGKVTAISLDHDLGELQAGDGYQIAKWIEDAALAKKIPRLDWDLHTANPVGRKNMEAALKNADRYWDEAELEEGFEFFKPG